MGIHDRDYYRQSTRGWWDRFGDTPVTKWLVVVNVVVFVLQLFTSSRTAPLDLLATHGAYYLPAILDGEVWRIVTPHFLHSPRDLWHIVLNMFLLYMVGRELEAIYGSREFLCFYLGTALLISFGHMALGLLGAVGTPPGRWLGASGPVTAVFVLFACHFPRREMWVFGILPVPAFVLAVGVVLMDAAGMMGWGLRGVENLVHLLGALFGFGYHYFDLRISHWFPLRLPRVATRGAARPRLFVDEEPEPAPVSAPRPSSPAPTAAAARHSAATDEQLEAKLDQVLEKVARFGKESLTPDEQSILLRASEIYKRRRGY